ncbi:MAG: hypothetical protein SPJ34_03935 [Candidatus Ornithospirochaeta sp.]|nr:hypothetical protein [Candidatus Ornithospirochaeta sp.]
MLQAISASSVSNSILIWRESVFSQSSSVHYRSCGMAGMPGISDHRASDDSLSLENDP